MDTKTWTKTAMKVLEETSRTFYIPIALLPEGIREAVASAYLCLRAIDEVEDHPKLENKVKAKILRDMSIKLQQGTDSFTAEDFTPDFGEYKDQLPEVSLRIGEWVLFCPRDIAPRIWDATAAMADRMAYWAEVNWKVEKKEDLDAYTFSVAGAVGILLCDLWAWWDGTKTDRQLAIGFGRGLQSVNILRNAGEDKERGVTFYPPDWTDQDMMRYSSSNLEQAQKYIDSLREGSAALTFCRIPFALAHGTLQAKLEGKEKLSRTEVMAIIAKCSSQAYDDKKKEKKENKTETQETE